MAIPTLTSDSRIEVSGAGDSREVSGTAQFDLTTLQGGTLTSWTQH